MRKILVGPFSRHVTKVRSPEICFLGQQLPVPLSCLFDKDSRKQEIADSTANGNLF